MILTLLRVCWLTLKRDRVALLLTFVLPVVFFSIFAVIFGGQGGGGTKAASIAIADLDDSVASRRLVAELAAPGTFLIERVETRADIDRALVDGKVSAALVIPPGLARGLGHVERGGTPPEIELIYDGAEAVLAGNAEGFLRSMVAATGAQLVARATATGARCGPAWSPPWAWA